MFKILVLIFVKNIYKMQHLEGSGTPVLYIGRTVLLRLINVLYVNKQEFSASSWRSNQGYTKMHGQPTINILKGLTCSANARIIIQMFIDLKVPGLRAAYQKYISSSNTLACGFICRMAYIGL